MNNQEKIVIIGAGGLGREIKNLLVREHGFAGFIDDKPSKMEYLGNLDSIGLLQNGHFLVAIGDPLVKKAE